MNGSGCGLVLLLILNGCVSKAPASENLPRVPVYQIVDETPCEYEAIGRAEAEAENTGRSDLEYRRAMEEALGIQGARMGADAVIVRDFKRRLPFVRNRADISLSRPRFEGTAVRWIRETCKF